MSSFRVKKQRVKKQVPEVRIGSERWQGLERKNALQHISMISADHLHIHYRSGWPEPYIFTVYDRIFGDFPAKKAVHTPYIYMVLANPNYRLLRPNSRVEMVSLLHT